VIANRPRRSRTIWDGGGGTGVPVWMQPIMVALALVGGLAVPCGLGALLWGEPWGAPVFAVCVLIWLAAMIAMALFLLSA
jgi:hypothetical protein